MTPPSDNVRSISERARTGGSTSVDPQMEFEEREVENADLLAALDEREEAREARVEANRIFKQKDGLVKTKLLDFHIATGEVVRVGRYKIKKTLRRGNEVAFTTEPREQLSISADGE